MSILWFLRYGIPNAIRLWRNCGLQLGESLHIEWMVSQIDVDEYFKQYPER